MDVDGLSSIIIGFPMKRRFCRSSTASAATILWTPGPLGPATLTPKVVPSGHLQVVHQEILCRAQAWLFLKRSLTSLVRYDGAPLATDPDEGKVHRLAEVSWRLRMMGCMPGAFELLVGLQDFFL